MNSLATTGLILLLLLGWVWQFYFWQRKAIRPRPMPKPLISYPSVTVIRPIKGVDSGVEDNLRAAFNHDYPGSIETFFVFDDASEPTVALVEKILGENRAKGINPDARILFSGHPPKNRTGKLNAMIAGYTEARHELIAFIDSDMRQAPDSLKMLVETLLEDDRAGSAFPPVSSSAPPLTAGDVGYALMVNGLYEPAALATAHANQGGLPFIMGHLMVLRREAIEAIGGLETAEGQLVDDMYLGRRMVEEGYRNKIAPKAVDIVQQGTTTDEFIQILIRWIAFSMSGLPLFPTKIQHALTGIAFWMGLLISAWLLIEGPLWLALAALLVPLSVNWVINDLHFRWTGNPVPLRFSWVSSAIWLGAPLIYVQIFTRREVQWRGRRYRINARSRLHPSA